MKTSFIIAILERWISENFQVYFLYDVFLENEILYGRSFEMSDEVLDKDHVAPIGKVKI